MHEETKDSQFLLARRYLELASTANIMKAINHSNIPFEDAQAALLFALSKSRVMLPHHNSMVATANETKTKDTTHSFPRQWQRHHESHIHQRKITIMAIIHMFLHSSQSHAGCRRQKTHRLAQKVELTLYRTSSSLEEYADERTLRQRVYRVLAAYKKKKIRQQQQQQQITSKEDHNDALQRRIHHVVALYRKKRGL